MATSTDPDLLTVTEQRILLLLSISPIVVKRGDRDKIRVRRGTGRAARTYKVSRAALEVLVGRGLAQRHTVQPGLFSDIDAVSSWEPTERGIELLQSYVAMRVLERKDEPAVKSIWNLAAKKR